MELETEMIKLDIVVPSKEPSFALKLQLKIVFKVIELCKQYNNLEVRFIFNFNCTNNKKNNFLPQNEKIIYHYNGTDLGFDMNVFQSIFKSNADYVHILSDNDYRSIDYWKAMFSSVELINNLKNEELWPLLILPTSKYILDYVEHHPYWYEKGARLLFEYANQSKMVDLNTSDELMATAVMCSSQLSHFIIRRSDEVQYLINEICSKKNLSSYFKSGLPHSLYLIEALNIELKNHKNIYVLPFISPSLDTDLPEKKRSKWFHNSTFIGQNLLYNIKYKPEDNCIELPQRLRNISSEINDYLTSFGLRILLNDCHYFEKKIVEEWLSYISIDEKDSKKYFPKYFKRTLYKIKKNLLYYLFYWPTFLFRYYKIVSKK